MAGTWTSLAGLLALKLSSGELVWAGTRSRLQECVVHAPQSSAMPAFTPQPCCSLLPSHRVYLDQQGLPLSAVWDAGSATLVVSDASASADPSSSSSGSHMVSQGAHSTGGRGRGGRGNGGGRGQGRGNHAGAGGSEGGAAEAQPYGEWLASLPAVGNPQGLPAAVLPLKVRLVGAYACMRRPFALWAYGTALARASFAWSALRLCMAALVAPKCRVLSR